MSQLVPHTSSVQSELMAGYVGDVWATFDFHNSGYIQSVACETNVAGEVRIVRASLDDTVLEIDDLIAGKAVFHPGDKLRLDLTLPPGTTFYRVLLHAVHILQWSKP